jgi:hypothetical protein
MQVLIPKATDVGFQQNNLVQQSALQQQQFAEQMAKTAEVRQQQVQGIVKGQGGKIERDEKKERNNKRQSGDASQNRSAASEESLEVEAESMKQDPILGHIIDIKT